MKFDWGVQIEVSLKDGLLYVSGVQCLSHCSHVVMRDDVYTHIYEHSACAYTASACNPKAADILLF